MRRDWITGLVCLLASLGLFAATIGLPEASLLVPVGPGFYPRIVLGITAVFSAALIVTGLMGRKADAEVPAGTPKNYRLVLLTFAIVGIYVVLLPYLGFRIATFGFVLILQVALEPPRSRKDWLRVVIVALATTLVTYLVFERYLSVLLPRGHWTDF
ncbi:MAG: tripartite tricarboxylate transporter TctB family protein [Burkholderiales bacterium]|nr:tripartite tricarboxylate transporter TctB family protein [Burkholderiales bacterium]